MIAGNADSMCSGTSPPDTSGSMLPDTADAIRAMAMPHGNAPRSDLV